MATKACQCAVCGRPIHRTEPGPFGVIWVHDDGWDPSTVVHVAKPKGGR